MKLCFYGGFFHCLIVLCCALCTGAFLGFDFIDYVTISGDSNVVVGATARLKAEIFDSEGHPATGNFIYEWMDNSIPEHKRKEKSNLWYSFWNVSYDVPGPFNVEVIVSQEGFIPEYFRKASQRFSINVTRFLSGEMMIRQGNDTRNMAIAVNQTAVHNISLSEPDAIYVQNFKNEVHSYWFVDCVYKGVTNGMEFPFNYTTVDKTHYVEALVVASYEAPPTTPIPSTTTTSSTTTTTSKPPTTATPANVTTTPKSSNSTTTAAPLNITTTPAPLDPWSEFVNNLSKYNGSANNTGFCINMSSIPLSQNATYGLFQKKFVTKAPIVEVTMTGSNWLPDGTVLDVNVTCNASSPISFCISLIEGHYNVTGNETCSTPKLLPSCFVPLAHLFPKPLQYTFILILENPVSKLVAPIGVDVYQVKKQTQISVVVVPVVFSIVAVILIVAGVAWYVHTRRTFPVEVADFDFGHTSNDMEYKTFRERLRESVMASFFRTADPDESRRNRPSPSRKYGSMK